MRENKNAEVLRERLDMLSQSEAYVGTFFSKEWVRKNVLRMSDEEIEEIDKQIENEEGDEGDEFDMEAEYVPPQYKDDDEEPVNKNEKQMLGEK